MTTVAVEGRIGALDEEVQRVIREMALALDDTQRQIRALSTGGGGTGGQLIDARDYGVTGNGSTDDTAAIETAITASAGKTLWFAPGLNCLIQSQVDINSSVRIMAHGATFTEGGAFSGSNLVRVAAQDVLVEGLTLVGNGTGKTGFTVTAGVASGMTIRECKVTGCGYGIIGNSNSSVTIERNYVYGCSNLGIWCQNIADTTQYENITVRDNRVDTSHLNPASTTIMCILVRGGGTNPYRNARVTGNTMTCPVNPTSSTAMGCEMRSIDGGVFAGNYCKDGAMLLSLALCKGVTAEGNVCDGATFYGIEVAPGSGVACEDITIADNTIHGRGVLNYGIGIQGLAASGRTTVTGNTIRSTVLYGIFVNEQHDDVVIAGNTIYMDTASSNHGIFLQAASGTISNVAITGNMLNGASTAKKAIYVDDVSNVCIAGNSIANWTENGVMIQSQTGTVDDIAITGNAFLNCNSVIAKTGAGAFGTDIVVWGNSGVKPTGTAGANYRDWNGNVLDAWGTGSPESNVTAAVGSTYLRTNGGASTTLYIKESGTGNTGWIAK